MLLSEVLARLSTLPLTPVQLGHLINFYTNRLTDVDCIAEVLKGLRALVVNHPIPDANVAAQICRGYYRFHFELNDSAFLLPSL
jgi:hypothetical protein